MNKLEEIKKFFNQNCDEWGRDDVEYLLSIIEQAEKDIETAYDYIKQTNQEITKNHLLKALQAIRKNN